MNIVQELTRITQAVSMASSPKEQVAIIVDELSRCLGMDVCSLYVIDTDQNMTLLASHGLDASRPVKIPSGKGLVGLVAKSRHTINLANGLEHPDYFHVEDIQEEMFKSFCGAPMVSHGEILGVLVVQARRAKRLSDKQEGFLTTLASHIALIVKALPKANSPAKKVSSYQGIVASEGVAIGSPAICKGSTLAEVSLSHCHDINKELSIWRTLLKKVVNELENEKAMLGQRVSSEISDMFDAYKMLLLDKAVSEHVETSIQNGFALPFALKLAIQHFSDIFQNIEDPYFKARGDDVWQIGNKIYQSYVGKQSNLSALTESDDGIILIGQDISVSDIAACLPYHLKGLVSVAGARLSHAAILANALGIPAVMGVEGILGHPEAKQIIVDGTEGKVFVDPAPTVVQAYTNVIGKQDAQEKTLLLLRDKPAITKSGTQIQLLVNSGLLSDITPGIRNGAEGIGLFRTEIAFMMRESFPTEEEQIELYKSVLSQYQNKPVYMRTLDIGSDKQLPYFPISGEENPAMGWRGVRFTLDNVQLLMTQLRAMMRAAGTSSELNIIVPMVSAFDELQKFHGVLMDARAQLKKEGYDILLPRLGVMVEVPAAISQLQFWTDYIDFVSIGTNDLSQYVLALDRNNPKVAAGFNLIHPAVIYEVYRAVKEAKKLGLPVCVCGEMASDPVSVLLLIAMGVRTLSLSAAKILKLKSLILNVEDSVLATFLEYALKQRNAQDIRSEGDRIIEQLIAT